MCPLSMKKMTDDWRLMTGGGEQIHASVWRWRICPQSSVISRQSSVPHHPIIRLILRGRQKNAGDENRSPPALTKSTSVFAAALART
jgi:hypothetical protein